MPEQFDITLYRSLVSWTVGPERIPVTFSVIGGVEDGQWYVHVVNVRNMWVDTLPKVQQAPLLGLLKSKLENATGRDIRGLNWSVLTN